MTASNFSTLFAVRPLASLSGEHSNTVRSRQSTRRRARVPWMRSTSLRLAPPRARFALTKVQDLGRRAQDRNPTLPGRGKAYSPTPE